VARIRFLFLLGAFSVFPTLTRAQDLTDSEISVLFASSLNPDSPGAPASIESVNQLRQERLVNLFSDLGAEVKLLDVHEDGVLSRHKLPVKNVQAVLPGEHGDKIILLGAHLDQVAKQSGQARSPHGVIDDWSGIALLVKLYEHLKRHSDQHGKLNHTFVFVGFAYEESGLWGSESYVQQLAGKNELSHVKAMVNFECLGVSDLFTWDNGSTEWLEELGESVARRLDGVSLTRRMLTGVGADSVPFILKQRPAITFDSLSASDFGKIHTAEDNLSNISNDKYRTAFRFAANYVLELDSTLTTTPELADVHETLPATFTGFPDNYSLRHLSWEPTSESVVPQQFASAGNRPQSELLAQATTVRFRKAIEQANHDWLRAAEAADAKGLSSIYTTDATIVPPDSGSTSGRDSVERYYAELFARVGGGIKTNFKQDSILVSEHVAFEQGVYSGTPSIESFVIWKPVQVNGKLVAQMQFDAWRKRTASKPPALESKSVNVGTQDQAAIQIMEGVVAIQVNGLWEIVAVRNGMVKRTPLRDIPESLGTSIFP
jgi:hypothetical protein